MKRYQRIEDVDETYLEQLKHQVDTSLYRQTFHIQPEMGLLNDQTDSFIMKDTTIFHINGFR